MRTFPEIRVTRRGAIIESVEWDPCDGSPTLDLHSTFVRTVETTIMQGKAPATAVTFIARLVEIDADA